MDILEVYICHKNYRVVLVRIEDTCCALDLGGTWEVKGQWLDFVGCFKAISNDAKKNVAGVKSQLR